MKQKFTTILACLVLVSPVLFAQSKPDIAVISPAQQEVDTLKSQLAAALARIQNLEKPVKPSEAQKNIRKEYVTFCNQRGLKFAGIQTDILNGKISDKFVILCK